MKTNPARLLLPLLVLSLLPPALAEGTSGTGGGWGHVPKRSTVGLPSIVVRLAR